MILKASKIVVINWKFTYKELILENILEAIDDSYLSLYKYILHL